MLIVQLRMLLHHTAEALVAFSVGRHHETPCDFQHHWAALHTDAVVAQAGGITAHGAPCLHVVATDIGGVVVGRGLALEEYYGDAFLLGFIHTGRKWFVLIGRND